MADDTRGSQPLHAGPGLYNFRNYVRFSDYLYRLHATEQLGLTKVMGELRRWIDCDVLMLVSRKFHPSDHRRLVWKLRRYVVGPDTELEIDCGQRTENEAFQELLEELIKGTQLNEQSGGRLAISEFQPLWLSPREADDAPIPESLKSWNKLRDHWPTLGAVCIGLLGYRTIGEWPLGESLLVAVNSVSDSGGTPSGSRPLTRPQMEPSFHAFSVYLSEVDSHCLRKAQTDSKPLHDRRERLKDEHVRHDYLRSAWRLARLIDKDIGVTIETLVEIEGIVNACGKMPPEPFTVPKAEAQLLESYYCIKDSDDSPSNPEHQARRNQRVRQVEAMWECARLRRDARLERGEHRGVRSAEDEVREIGEARDEPGQQSPETTPADDKTREERVEDIAKRGCDLLDLIARCFWAPKQKNLELNGRTLAAFFLCKIAEWRRSGRLPNTHVIGGEVKRAGVDERLVFVERLAIVAQYALGARETDVDTLRALLWLVSEFGHEALGLDRRIDLEKHLGLAAMEQPALYGMKRFYRDHLNHVIQVCLTGWLLLETRLGEEKEPLWRRVAAQMDADSEEEVLRQWFLAAIVHDVGYVVEVGKGWGTLLDLFEDEALRQVHKGVRRELKKLTKRTVQEDWGYVAKDDPGEDHGVVAALHTRCLIDDLDQQREVGDFEHAILAMAHHNHWRAEIPFDTEPLSVLLVLCDELQEWDRPWMDLEGVGLAMSAARIYREGDQNQWAVPLTGVKTNIVAKWREGENLSLTCGKKKSVLDFKLKYGDDVHKRDGIFSAWLGRSSALQRLDLTSADFDVRYRMVSDAQPPVSTPRRSPGEPELERLRQLIRDQRLWYLSKWVPTEMTLPKWGGLSEDVGSAYEHSAGKETLVLNVKALGKQRPILDSLDRFRDAAREWSLEWQGPDPVV